MLFLGNLILTIAKRLLNFSNAFSLFFSLIHGFGQESQQVVCASLG
jgi:hypothetical protein